MKTLNLLISNYQYVPAVLSLLGAGISVYTDIRWGEIKNHVTFPLIFFGLLWSYFTGGLYFLLFNTVVSFFIGVFACFGGVLGKGDVKLIVGTAACLQPMANIMFLAFFYIVLACSAVFVRFRAHEYKLKQAFLAMKNEILMELSGIRDANYISHGKKVKHLGGPVILVALILCLIKINITGGAG